MTQPPRRVAIVGASAAGLAVATGLRDEGFDGDILLIGAEDCLPYDRPPLSKKGFARELAAVALTDAEEVAELGLELHLGVAARALDRRDKTVILESGEELAFDACVIATGAAPVRLPGAGLVLRSFEDALAIDSALDAARSVAIIGAGVLGCEPAALARGKGVETRVSDPLGGPMLDKLGPEVSARLEALHRERGAAFRFGLGAEVIAGSAESGFRVSFTDGTAAETDLVLVAVGCRPAVGWLAGSGLTLDNGVHCDATCQAARGIYAAGDVANWLNPRYGRRMRIEHRMNATEQGMAVAANLLGAKQPFAPIPFFWSDQYDAKIQVFGVIDGALQTDILATTPDNGGFVAAYSRQDKVEGVLGWNMARALRSARGLIGKDRTAAISEYAQAQRA